MKKFILLMLTGILLTVLCGFTLLACNDDTPQNEKTKKNGEVLLGDKLVPATTIFSEDEVRELLDNSKWKVSSNYVYNISDMSLKSATEYNEETARFCEFYDGNNYHEWDAIYDYGLYTYRITGKTLELNRNHVYYTSPDGKERLGYEMSFYKTIVAADKDCIIYDSDSLKTTTFQGKEVTVELITCEEENEVSRTVLIPAK